METIHCAAKDLPPDVLRDEARTCAGVLKIAPDHGGLGKHLYRCVKHATMVERMNPDGPKFISLETYKRRLRRGDDVPPELRKLLRW